MAKNPEKCPYFIRMRRQIIVCKGCIAGCDMHQGYAEAGMEEEHYAVYCCRNYHSCITSQMLNTVWNEYEVSICRYNSGVDCLHEDECDRCGWNPAVAADRLRKWTEKHGC